MDFNTFLDEVINDGIDAARIDYAEKPNWLAGALQGFEMCRGKNPLELSWVLARVRTQVHDAFRNDMAPDPYWEVRCREAEIEWVCNCVSALRYLTHTHPMEIETLLVPPTARGVLKAAEVLRRLK